MIRFRAFDAFGLRDEHGAEVHAVLAQPKRLGLLLYLAVARPGSFHQRDRLLALFWPELDEEHARDALNQALRFLRRHLGERVLISRGDEIGIDPGLVECDCVRFEALLNEGRAREALELYRGDLIGSVHASASPEFDQWLDEVRLRLRSRALEAAGELRAEAERAGETGLALHWARRAVAIDPLDETAVRALMAGLDAAGDRAGAARAFEELSRKLRIEFDLDTAPETRALFASISHRSAAAADPATAVREIESTVAAAAVAKAEGRPRRGNWSRMGLIAAGLVLSLLGIGLLASFGSPSQPGGIAPTDLTERRRQAESLYERARFEASQTLLAGDSAVRSSIRYYEEAIALDSSHADAWAGLSVAYMTQAVNFTSLSADGPRARAAADRAVALDPNSAPAYWARALVRKTVDWDYTGAEHDLKRSIWLDPRNARSHSELAELLYALGRFTEAFAHAEQSIAIDSSGWAPTKYYWLLPLVHPERVQIVIDSLWFVWKADSTSAQPLLKLMYLYDAAGRFEEAVGVVERFRRASPPRLFNYPIFTYARLLGRAGRHAEAERIYLERRRHGRDLIMEASILFSLGRRNEGFTLLERAAETHHPRIPGGYLNSPMFWEVRNDPRFIALRKRVGLPE